MKNSLKSCWQTLLSQAITSPEVLLEKLHLNSSAYLESAKKAALIFGLKVTESFVERMEKNNPNDPLLLQVLPLNLELQHLKGFTADPLQEKKFNPLVGVLHKYQSRVLINLISHCAIHCRYCFRREFPYHENNPGKKGWNNIFTYLASHPAINEVILSGADPLSAPDKVLQEFSDRLLELPQIKTLRIHTRMPIVLPERISPELARWLSHFPLNKILVLHTNHPNEINDSVRLAVSRLNQSQVTVLNQSVLLKNVNNNADILVSLNEKLGNMRVLPYYLHLLDKVRGTAHFEVTEQEAKKIMKILQERLPGYLVPKLVREIPGKKHKTVIL